MRRARRWWNILGKIADALADFFGIQVPETSSIRSDVRQMLAVLSVRADAASYAMALADEKYEQLKQAVADCENWQRQAEKFMAAGDEAKARRCLALKLQSEKLIGELNKEYVALQCEAESQAETFRSKQLEVKTKVAELPKLEQDLALIKAQEKIQKVEDDLDFDTAERSYDHTVQKVKRKKFQLQNRILLINDNPNAELDQEIQEAIGREKLEAAMENLRKKISKDGGIIEPEIIDADIVEEARKALEAPRYKGLLPESGAQKAEIPFKKVSVVRKEK